MCARSNAFGKDSREQQNVYFSRSLNVTRQTAIVRRRAGHEFQRLLVGPLPDVKRPDDEYIMNGFRGVDGLGEENWYRLRCAGNTRILFINVGAESDRGKEAPCVRSPIIRKPRVSPRARTRTRTSVVGTACFGVPCEPRRSRSRLGHGPSHHPSHRRHLSQLRHTETRKNATRLTETPVHQTARDGNRTIYCYY